MSHEIDLIDDPKILLRLGEKALLNAKELYFESRLFFCFKRYSRALFLAQIGGEEIGKHILCLSSYVDYRIGQFNISKFRDRFYNHKEKSMLVGFMEDVLLDTEVKNYSERQKEAKILENAKYMGLYTDMIEGYIFKPSDICNAEITRQAVRWLGNRIKLFGKINFNKIAQKMELIKNEEIVDFHKKLMKKYFSELEI
jgi:AbiV family abortive infection protein